MDGTITEAPNLQTTTASTTVLRTSPRTSSRTAAAHLTSLSTISITTAPSPPLSLPPAATTTTTTTTNHATSSGAAVLQKLMDDIKPDIVQSKTTSHTLRNKRKNFNPRCSSANGDGEDIEPSPDHHENNCQDINPPASLIQGDVTVSCQHEMLSSTQTMHSSSGKMTTSPTSSYRNHKNNSFSRISSEPSDDHSDIHNYSGDSTNHSSSNAITTSLLKSWQNLFNLQNLNRDNHDSRTNSSRPFQQTSTASLDANDTGVSNVEFVLSKTQSDGSGMPYSSQTENTRLSTPTLERQLRSDFTCNAFNAVQELLNVYGLSISPSDIVDAFKKQQQLQQKQHDERMQQFQKIGVCTQPPTPPRTPNSALSATTPIASSVVSGEEKDDDESLPRNQTDEVKQSGQPVNSDSDKRASKLPLITLAPVSKLIASPTVSSTTTTSTTSSAAIFQQDALRKTQSVLLDSNSGGGGGGAGAGSSNNNNYNSQSVCSNEDCGVGGGGGGGVGGDDDDATPIGEVVDDNDEDDDDFDSSETSKCFRQQQHHHHHSASTNFSDRFDDSIASSANLYDINNCYNDNDSNISSMIDDDRASSDDLALATADGSGRLRAKNRRNVGDGRASAGGNGGGGGLSGGGADEDRDATAAENRIGGNSNDRDSSSISSMKNIDSILEKCSLLAQMQSDDKQLHVEGMKYLTKFSSYLQCKNDSCQLENLREHYHCYDVPCLGKTFNKKEEIIRHLKWHKKRAESLNHGFLRFSSSDDCSLAFGTDCTHNRKQTHYHCFQPNCDKVYISTSDVQMHSNYHRKDTAIYQEGFQRYRATEECNADYCMFAGQRTTHFHCRRDNCRYTFKNKADMEKHKSYHIKDLQLARDGFKKFLKSEPCPFERCRFSRICNHIHCVRENCHYVLHSSGQLLSHKRKHERMDSEQAYRRFKIAQKAAAAAMIPHAASPNASGSGNASILGAIGGGPESKPSTPSTTSSIAVSPDLQIPPDLTVSCASGKTLKYDSPRMTPATVPNPNPIAQPLDLSLFYGNSSLPLEILQEIHQKQKLFSIGAINNPPTDSDPNFPLTPKVPSTTPQPFLATPPSFLPLTTTRNTIDEIEDLIRQYFTAKCTKQSGDSVDQIEPLNLKSSTTLGTVAVAAATTNDGERIECPLNRSDPHLHCLVKNCDAIVSRNLADISEHMQMHELNKNADSIIRSSNLMQITSIEGFFNRKRGRPPKNRVVEVYNNARNQSPQAIFTSFKLEKTLNDPQVLSNAGVTSLRSANASTIVSNYAPYPLLTDSISPSASSASSLHATTSGSISRLAMLLDAGKIQIVNSDTTKCSDNENENCSLVRQFHFHCKYSTKCSFVAKDPFALEQHLIEYHSSERDECSTGVESIVGNVRIGSVKDWHCFDMATSCQVENCVYKQKCDHFHCAKCNFATASQIQIENHVVSSFCTTDAKGLTEDSRVCATASATSLSSLLSNNNNEKRNEKSSGGGSGGELSDAARVLSLAEQYQRMGEAGSHERQASDSFTSSSPIKLESTQSEDEKVSVVRAAGTYFPQNSNNSSDAEAGQLHHHSGQTSPLGDSSVGGILSACQRPFCKLKRKPHQHCHLCNQAFSDSVKFEIHRLKHSSLSLASRVEDADKEATVVKEETNPDEHSSPQDLSKSQIPSPTTSPMMGFTNAAAAAAMATGMQQILPQSFVDNFSMQNLHLAQLALYQQNPFYYQNFYPFLNAQNLPAAFAAHPELLHMQLAVAAAASGGGTGNSEGNTSGKQPTPTEMQTDSLSGSSAYPFAAIAGAVGATSTSSNVQSSSGAGVGQPFNLPKLQHDLFASMGRRKRKAEDYDGLMDAGMASAARLASVTAAKKAFKANKQGNFKIFKDEPIPHGYLKFRFNEDCNFPNCGYRNHQSHFHCCRKDCYYSFCDKTRFVQHTARHERLDKLMGDDFKQYRANMRCGYEDCAYNKNLAGQNNKSSHFHCLKCNFICSDTNKVVAHRRQHSKMEFIRMAGFRKVANNEKCSTRAGSAASGAATSETASDGSIISDTTANSSECTYSLKQTHYHCLVCDCSVLSRAQLGAHRHRVP